MKAVAVSLVALFAAGSLAAQTVTPGNAPTTESPAPPEAAAPAPTMPAAPVETPAAPQTEPATGQPATTTGAAPSPSPTPAMPDATAPAPIPAPLPPAVAPAPTTVAPEPVPAPTAVTPTPVPAPTAATPAPVPAPPPIDYTAWKGLDIKSPDGKTVGEVAEVVPVGSSYEIHADVGGFLGFGERRVKLLPDQLNKNSNFLATTLTGEQIKALPTIGK